MLKALSNNRAGLHKEVGLLICMVLIMGCTYYYDSGMTEIDKGYQDAGMSLHCTEVFGERCLTHQWFDEQQNTYRRFGATSN